MSNKFKHELQISKRFKKSFESLDKEMKKNRREIEGAFRRTYKRKAIKGRVQRF